MPPPTPSRIYTPLAMRGFKRGMSGGGQSLEDIKRGIAYVETRNAPNAYAIMGKPRPSDGKRALGKYQVFETNLPSWTKEALGRELTREEFLASPDAQERVAEHFMGQSLKKYGNPEDVASVWFTGRPVDKANNAADYTGTDNSTYQELFKKGMAMGKSTYQGATQGLQDFGAVLGGAAKKYIPLALRGPEKMTVTTPTGRELPIPMVGGMGARQAGVGAINAVSRFMQTAPGKIAGSLAIPGGIAATSAFAQEKPVEMIEVDDNDPSTWPPDISHETKTSDVPRETPKTVKVRGNIDLSDEDLDELRAIIYSEIGNREDVKKKLEARVVANTALNRLEEYRKRGRGPQTLTEVLRAENQYQGYDPDNSWTKKMSKGKAHVSQYNLAKTGKANKAKMQAIEEILEEIKSGQLEDNTNGAFYYIHKPDSTIEYDDTRPL